MAKYHIGTIRPQGYQHSDCFREVAEGLQSALRTLGHTVTCGENTVDAQAASIVLGAHLLTEDEMRSLPASTIVYNLEQLGAPNLPQWYMEMASRVQIWDYSPLHIEMWRKVDCNQPPLLVEVGFAPELRRIRSNEVQDIDVLFYGSVNNRRLKILGALKAAGLNVQAAFGVYGSARDALIARSKVVLNLHAYENKVFEVVRVSYLLANAKAVVSEDAPDMGCLREALAVFPYEGLVEGCMRLVRDAEERALLGARGYRMFSARQQARILWAVVGSAQAVA